MAESFHTDDLTETLLNAAIGKALVRKGVLTREDIVNELAQFAPSGRGRADQELAGTLGRIIDAVQRW